MSQAASNCIQPRPVVGAPRIVPGTFGNGVEGIPPTEQFSL